MALLYFHGGPQCNIVLQYPVVKSVTMPVGNQDAAVEDTASTQGTTQVRQLTVPWSDVWNFRVQVHCKPTVMI